VLGVPRDASRETVDAAREAARLKYAPDHVAHLGPELQEHYRQKQEAVERAYQILTG
jgi:preprotein translocase subunit Sec63